MTLGDKSKAETGLGVSVAKGQFASIIMEVVEGVLGPYKVQGPEAQRFVTVMANSEKVFLDGKPLQRGFNYDYIIDYNLGEITFTNKVLITKFSRIRVDYEFFVQNYSRTVVAGYHNQQLGDLKVYTQVYSEKDNPKRPLLVNLNQDEIDRLSQIGDNLDLAVISGADSVEFTQNRILYRKTDTLVQGVTHVIYQRSVDPADARYSVKFSQVSANRGNYILKSTTANGRVYQWVAPVDGRSQGDFQPIIRVPTPNQKQMITLGAQYNLSEYESVFSEIAWSNHDLNLFSRIDNDDNQGRAYKGGLTSKGRPLGAVSSYKLAGDLSFEYNDRYFQPIDRYRYIEFDRDWSFNPETETKPAQDHILNLSMGLKKDISNYVNYQLSSRKRGQSVDGNQHLFEAAQQIGSWNVAGDLFMTQNDQSSYHSDWIRTNLTTFYATKYLVPGYSYRLDRNQVTYRPSDSIVSTANNFREHRFFLRTNDSLRTKVELNYSIREDRAPMLGELKKNDLARTANLMVSSRIKSHSRFDLTFTYRNLENINPDLNLDPQDRSEHSVTSRVDWFGNAFKKHLRTELTYAVANSRELKREFVFLEVNPGEGTHTWRDDNQDGVQDLNEFYEAINHDERNFAKIFLPTDDYVLANNNLFNFKFDAKMPRNWAQVGGAKQFLSKFSNNTSWTIDKKTTDDDLGSRFNPWERNIMDENLLSLRENFRTTFFFNRAQSKYGVDGAYSSSARKQLLTDGFESRVRHQYSMNGRLNLAREYNLKFGSRNYIIGNASDYLLTRNYRIQAYDLLPGLSWQPSTRVRLNWNYRFSFKNNVYLEGAGEKSKINEISFEARWNRATKSNFSSGFRFLQIEFEGDPNTPVGYELLEALRPGGNYTWNLMYQRKILSGLQLTVNYDGRISEDRAAVHIGRMQVTALF